MGRKLKIIAVVVLILALIVGMLLLEAYQFNDGICRDCGTKLTPIGVSKSGQTYWKCENCYYGCYS